MIKDSIGKLRPVMEEIDEVNRREGETCNPDYAADGKPATDFMPVHGAWGMQSLRFSEIGDLCVTVQGQVGFLQNKSQKKSGRKKLSHSTSRH
ncbi:MAG: hypothetical protein ACXWLZ_05280 [Rhizomicrobium sp.]